MKHAVSNILWGEADISPYLELLVNKRCYGVEIAPSLFWEEPVESSLDERRNIKKLIEGYGLRIVSLHTLLYTRPDLGIFASRETRQKTKEYIFQLGSLAADMNCRLMVLGSPKNRMRKSLDDVDVRQIAVDFFSSLANMLSNVGVILCIEPLSRKEADFITSALEGLRYVREVNHLNFRLMLDSKSMHLEKENYDMVVAECINYLEHVHVNDPGNSPLETMGVNHKSFGDALRYHGYDKTVSLEVGRGFGNPMDVMSDCIGKMKKYY